MFAFPCPWCAFHLEVLGEAGAACRCPNCRQVSRSLVFDDPEVIKTFPLVQWVPVQDGRSSEGHCKLRELGINGAGIFFAGDPVLGDWFAARRKGIRPCRCDVRLVSRFEAQGMGIDLLVRRFVAPLSFDPWSPDDNCELLERLLA